MRCEGLSFRYPGNPRQREGVIALRDHPDPLARRRGDLHAVLLGVYAPLNCQPVTSQLSGGIHVVFGGVKLEKCWLGGGFCGNSRRVSATWVG
jgi:hypothetical protein